MKKIPLTQGYVALVDDGDYENLSQHKWHVSTDKYTSYARNSNSVKMHRLLMGAATEVDIDHRDGNGLNNQRRNLRKCTKAQNGHNRRLNENNTSGYKGVHWYKRDSKWYVTIRVNRKKVHLGAFTCIVKAAKAYDTAARKHFGEFARTNFALEPA